MLGFHRNPSQSIFSIGPTTASPNGGKTLSSYEVSLVTQLPKRKISQLVCEVTRAPIAR
jgi:hypothetical protein